MAFYGTLQDFSIQFIHSVQIYSKFLFFSKFNFKNLAKSLDEIKAATTTEEMGIQASGTHIYHMSQGFSKSQYPTCLSVGLSQKSCHFHHMFAMQAVQPAH